ncbi:MAG: hypothetical protein WCG27_10455 [Pseudomonadota bacterium]
MSCSLSAMIPWRKLGLFLLFSLVGAGVALLLKPCFNDARIWMLVSAPVFIIIYLLALKKEIFGQ